MVPRLLAAARAMRSRTCADVIQPCLARIESGLTINMAAITALNPKAEVARSAAALHLNITAARGLQDVLKTNLGPKGTMKM